ncbi:DJ-1/PfpI family protein [Alicyclobacillus fodiniaquatilis]|jgi:transcriptional regulator GlxA family with amidase domain|uniref:DJ-1/PfpI family protein n=1 Tax=Alicyclobacillus fodiniaquatilis TaxID=1661150 RepID=A0ABW4JEE8_9BACL
MRKAAFVALPGCLLGDLSALLRQIQHQGWRLRVFSLDGKPTTTGEGLHLLADAPLENTMPADLHLLMIPGGHYTPDVYQDIRLHRFLRQYDGQRRWIAASCEGVVCLGAAQLLGGVAFSAPASVRTNYEHILRHAVYRPQPITIDANIISSDGTNPVAWMKAVKDRIDLEF